jgi:hypothetical protein
MNDPLGDLLAAWKDAERDETRTEEGDRAFAELARAWPREAASAALVARVAVLGREASASDGIWAAWWLRGAVATALVMAGAALGGLSGSAFLDLLLASFGAVGGMVTLVFATVGAWLISVAAVAGPCVRVGAAIGNALMAPEPLLVLGVNVLLAAGALTVLRRVLATREV